mgnify:FL=1
MRRMLRTHRQRLLWTVVTFGIVFIANAAMAQGARRLAARQSPVFPPLSVQQQAEKQQLLRGTAVRPAPSDRRPNIVLLLADDLGYADIGCYGSRDIPTPHIDRLAARGMRFSNAYVTAATCSPSRAALLTGRYQQRYGFEFNTGPQRVTHRAGRGLDPTAVTIADVLRQAGYATGAVGKWHLGSREQFHPINRGFDEFFGFLAGAHAYLDPSTLSAAEQEVSGPGSTGAVLRGFESVAQPEYLTDAFAREAVSFIERHQNRPFFLYVAFNAVHTPIQATDKYQDRFADVEDLKRQTYYAMTSALDEAVGAILAALRANDLAETTLVIFTNDNGGPTYTEVQSNGPLRLGKMYLFEGGIRVPLICAGNGVPRTDEICDATVSTLDLFPTLCDLANITPPDDRSLDGVSLLPLLDDAGADVAHRPLCWRNGSNRAIRKGPWKLIAAGEHIWLFDLSADIGERHNVADAHPEIVQELTTILSEWEKTLASPAWPPRPNARTVEVDGIPYRLEI